ncbi:MAG: amidohydrolase [Deltaproteobacteria bacterium]|nr:amidohydrolase [Deltaproteobacteria bacterium]
MVGLIGALVALHVGTAAAAELVIVHATILPVVGPPITDGTLVVSDGRITAVGAALPVPPGAVEVVDAGGAYLLPGLIDLHSHMGVYPWPGGPAHSDGNEATHPTTPAVWTGDSVRVLDPAFRAASAGGVTSALVLPGSANLIGGEGVVLKLRPGRTLHDMRFDGAPRHLKMACGENPKRVYGQDVDGPSTRMGNVRALRAAFQAARDYRVARQTRPNETPKDADLEVLLDVLDGKVRVNVHCYRHDDMEAMLRVMEDQGVKISAFHHATDAYKIRDLLAAKGVGVATWPDWWGFKHEAYEAIPENAALNKQAGVVVATHSDSPHTVQRLHIEAAKHVAAGLSEQAALETITIDPARLMGVADRVGSLEVGKDADLVLFSHHPFDVQALALRTWIDGRLVYDRAAAKELAHVQP